MKKIFVIVILFSLISCESVNDETKISNIIKPLNKEPKDFYFGDSSLKVIVSNEVNPKTDENIVFGRKENDYFISKKNIHDSIQIDCYTFANGIEFNSSAKIISDSLYLYYWVTKEESIPVEIGLKLTYKFKPLYFNSIVLKKIRNEFLHKN
jgi:hypothetical protein